MASSGKIRVAAAQFLAQMVGNQFAVEAAVFYEDFIRARAGDYYSGNVNARNV